MDISTMGNNIPMRFWSTGRPHPTTKLHGMLYPSIVNNDSTNKIFDQDGKSGYCLLLDDIATFPRDSLLSYSMGVDCFGWNE